MTATSKQQKRRRNRRGGQGSNSSPAAPAAAPRPATPPLFADRYRPEHLLGRGFAKKVYLALDTFTQEHVALGVFHWPEQATTRFIERANAVRDCGPHRNVAEVLDAGTGRGPEGSLWTFVTTRFVDNARRADEAVGLLGGPLPVADSLRYADGVLRGLQHLHEHGLCHGAPHPKNVLLDADGHPTIVDHDWVLPSGTSRLALDELVPIVGVHQTTPEQLRGLPHDERADLFVAGIGVFLIATGSYPYTPTGLLTAGNKSYDLLARRDRLPETPITLNPKLPQPFSDLLLHLLTPDPRHRPQSAAEALEELRRIMFPFHL